LRLPKFVLVLLVLAALLAWTSPGWAAAEPTRGTVQSVSPDKNQIIVTDKNGKAWTYQVPENAAIFVPTAANARLGDVKTGEDVSLLSEKQGDHFEALAILVHQGDFRNSGLAGGIVKRVMADTNEFIITDANGKEWTYHVANSARIRANNQGSKLADF